MLESEKIRKKIADLETRIAGIDRERQEIIGTGDDLSRSVEKMEALGLRRTATVDLKSGLEARLIDVERVEAIEQRKNALIEYERSAKRQGAEARTVIGEVMKNMEALAVSLEKMAYWTNNRSFPRSLKDWLENYADPTTGLFQIRELATKEFGMVSPEEADRMAVSTADPAALSASRKRHLEILDQHGIKISDSLRHAILSGMDPGDFAKGRIRELRAIGVEAKLEERRRTSANAALGDFTEDQLRQMARSSGPQPVGKHGITFVDKGVHFPGEK